MAGRGTTLKDLAESLDISVATASRALAGHERIALKTRERVAQAARDLGYVPNRAARALVSGRSGFACLALPIRGHGHEDAFLGELVAGLTAGFGRHGIDLFLAAVPAGKPEVAVIRNIVEARRADGLVLARTTESDPRVEYLVEAGFPFVSHGRVREASQPFPWVDTDGWAAFGEAFDMLHELGHRHIGFVTIDEPMTFRHFRAGGLEEAARRRGDPQVRIETVSSPRFDREARSAAIHGLLGRPDRPSAVIGLFDGIALSVMQEAAQLGLRIPEDLSVIGFDNIWGSGVAPPGLTTFDAAIHACAEEATSMLVRRIADPEAAPETKLVRPTLVPRGSHGPAPRR